MKKFNFLEKFIVKRVVKKILKKLPKLKQETEDLVAIYGDDVVEKVFEKVEQVVVDFAEDHKIKP
jgi:hypothetical protein